MNLLQLPAGVSLTDDRVSDIPAFNRWGYLPAGVHDACYEEAVRRFATNPVRTNLARRLEKFLLLVIDSHAFSHVYVGGEFATAAASPQEIDLILQTKEKIGPHAFQAMEPFLILGLDKIREKFSIQLHFGFDGSADALSSFRNYFQDVLRVEANIVAISRKMKKGMVRIKL